MIKLNTLSRSTKRQSKKRVGRGAGSGIGTYAGRGLKGQRSRTGGKGGLKLKGLKATFKGLPKSKGFTSPYAKLPVINVGNLEKQYESGAVVHLDTYKVLGQGDISKKLTVYANTFSKSAQQKIEQQGGKAISCGKPS